MSTNRIVFGRWNTVEEIIEANRRIGQHYFSPDTMEFFDSRVEPEVAFGRWFVTSESDRSLLVPRRRWTVRYADDDGTCHTWGEFHAYESSVDAWAAVAIASGTQRQSPYDADDESQEAAEWWAAEIERQHEADIENSAQRQIDEDTLADRFGGMRHLGEAVEAARNEDELPVVEVEDWQIISGPA
jgi:hypothetical protein